MAVETAHLPMDRSRPLTTLLSELKNRAQEGTIRVRFCDAYTAMDSYMKESKITDVIHEYDTFSERPASTPTLSLLCVLHTLSKNLPDQTDFILHLWANTMESVVRMHVYDDRSYQSMIDTFLRMFSSRPTKETFRESLPYTVGSIIPSLLENQTSYYEVQRILSEYFFTLGFGFHEGYINVLTLGLFCFLRITYGHIKQRQLIIDYLAFQTYLDLENVPYYDEPERIRQEFIFPL